MCSFLHLGRRCPGLTTILIAALLSVVRAGESPAPPPALWFYYSTNLQVADNLVPLEQVFRRAAAAGYTKVYLTDSKFSRLGTVPQSYFDNVAKVVRLADELHLEIVPGIFPVGWSDSLLSADVNLVESLPVKDALFVVDHGVARPVSDPPLAFPADGFSPQTHWTILDSVVHLENGVAHVSGAKGKNARVAIRLPVVPFHQYTITFRIKTQGYTAHPLVQVLSPDAKVSLNEARFRAKPTQDWITYHVVFNSLEQTQVLISFRAGYAASDGEMWWGQPRIEESGLLNLVRRESCPLTVRTEDGKVLTEGTDFEPVTDPKMGNVPYPGSYDVWHEPPQLKTNLPDGTRLLVSFYHAITTDEGKVNICLSEPKTLELLRDQARRVDALFHAKSYFMEHDEIRVLGWDGACQKSGLDAGGILAANIRDCAKIMQEVHPDATLYVWSDMFDPSHNAHDHYYLTRGGFAHSWDGLDTSIVIANWNSDKPSESLPWFANRGFHQILAGYYDSDPAHILDWLKAAQDVPHIDGVMYTTWENNFDDLERFAQLVRGFTPAK